MSKILVIVLSHCSTFHIIQRCKYDYFSGLIQIGNDFLQSSFSILENQPMDMLLGLDMLKRHQVSTLHLSLRTKINKVSTHMLIELKFDDIWLL